MIHTPEDQEMSQIGLLLAGVVGNGKSSTGNSILGSRVFNPRGGTASDTLQEIRKYTSSFDGYNLTVVDGIGFSDPVTDVASAEAIIRLAETAVAQFPGGFSAFIHVIKYGTRFTQQESNFIKTIKSIFGENIFRNYGIIVMTYGDSFELDNEDGGQTFEDWCRNQKGEIQNLFKEFDHRYVLFNNKTKDSARMEEQKKKLLVKVAEIQRKVPTYTSGNFRQAEHTRKQLRVSSKVPHLQQKTSEFMDKINQRKRKIEDGPYSEKDKRYELQELSTEIARFKKWLTEEDEGANVISQLLLQVAVTENTINTSEKKLRLEAELKSTLTEDRNATAGKDTNIRLVVVLAAIAIVVIVFILFIYLW